LLLLLLLLSALLQAHHLLNNGALVNQADGRGWTPLHRAAHLAHLEGYLEIYEYLLVRQYVC
jgi:[acyl-carrier-protein] S-malonyltransferase